MGDRELEEKEYCGPAIPLKGSKGEWKNKWVCLHMLTCAKQQEQLIKFLRLFRADNVV